MSYEENRISDLIDGGLAHEQDIYDRLATLQDKATAASLACIHYMSVDHQDNKKYLAALREHTEATREINKLKRMLNDGQRIE